MGIACFMAAFMVFCIIPSSAFHEQRTAEQNKVDFLGTFTGITGLMLINFSVNQGAAIGWERTYVYVILVIGFAILALFA